MPDEGSDDSLANHTAVFVPGLGQQQDELGDAAPGSGVTSPQLRQDKGLEVVHSPVQAVPGQLSALRCGEGEQGDMERFAAASGPSGHGVADYPEEIKVAQQCSGLRGLLKAL